MRRNRHTFLLFIGLLIFSGCHQKQGKVDRAFENGVEVVINHLEPYKIGPANSFDLEEAYKIDTEKDDLAPLGIVYIQGFDVDSAGELFILRSFTGQGDFLFKFDRYGKFVKSFGTRGEGPGELQLPFHIFLDVEENIGIFDRGRHPLNKYNRDGSFIQSSDLLRNAMKVTPGPGKSWLILENSHDPARDFNLFALKLLNSSLKEIKTIDTYGFKMEPKKLNAIEPIFCWSSSRDYLYVANENRGYEIWVSDLNGKLIRTLRKEYKKIPISENDKKEILSSYPPNMRSYAFFNFPEYFPPIRSLVARDDGMLLVSTFEKGENPGDLIYDIFNAEGVFVERKSLNAYVWENHLWARLKGNKLYCLRKKDSGYMELVVYNMKTL